MYKKIQLTVAAILLASITMFSSNVNAQDGFGYARLAVGYDLKSASATGANSTTTSATGQDYSLAQGLNFGLAGGYMFNKNVGADLEVNYLIGSPGTFTNTGNIDVSTTKTTSSIIRLTPSMVVSAGFDKINPYARFGLTFGIANNYTRDETTTAGSNVEHQIIKYSGGMAFGFAAAGGVSFGLSDKLMLYAEITSVNMSWAPANSEITTSTINGTDNLSNITNKKTTYSNTFSGTAGTGLAVSEPLSSFGIHIGLMMKF